MIKVKCKILTANIHFATAVHPYIFYTVIQGQLEPSTPSSHQAREASHPGEVTPQDALKLICSQKDCKSSANFRGSETEQTCEGKASFGRGIGWTPIITWQVTSLVPPALHRATLFSLLVWGKHLDLLFVLLFLCSEKNCGRENSPDLDFRSALLVQPQKSLYADATAWLQIIW